MGKKLIIVRHGNTFLPGQTPTRVGGGTDLPLVEEDRARAVGRYLVANDIKPDIFYAAPIKRTMETARLIADEMGLDTTVEAAERFTEIDYGPDENKTEKEVAMRLGRVFAHNEHLSSELSDEELTKHGEHIIELWNSSAVVPDGWRVDVEEIVGAWREFAESIEEGQTVLICTSNGIIRFAPHILAQPYTEFCKTHDIKVATGSVSIFELSDNGWECREWNKKGVSRHTEVRSRTPVLPSTRD